MPKYTFTFKKDDVFVEFYTADRDVVERQFQIWVADADDYVRNPEARKTRSFTPPPINYEKQETPEPIQSEDPPANPVGEVVEEKAQEPETQQEEKIIEEVIVEPEIAIVEEELKIEAQAEESSEPTSEQSDSFDKASTLLKTINTIQNPSTEEETPAETVDFEAVLEKSIENPTFEPTKTQDPVFLNLVKSKNTKDKFHYLIITAYYLSEFEKMERFALKQLNTKLMQNLSEVIDHATLQDAINQSLIEPVPDLTGTSEVGEYRLTRSGEEFFAKI